MKHHRITEQVITYIMTRTTKELAKLTRYQIAETFNINISYLSRRFKQDTQRTILDFIDSEKMLRAKYLLQHHLNMTIEEISVLLGISKVNQFREKFKKHYYITPGKFRKSYQRRQIGTTLPISSHV